MKFRVSAVLLWLTFISAATFAQTTVLGILEDVPSDGCASHSFGVRVVFRASGGEWKSFPSSCPDEKCLQSISVNYPSEIVWTITFDGKRLGKVHGKTPLHFNYCSAVGLQEITGSSSIPTIGQRSREFGGFSDCAAYRALVANSKSFARDPEEWRPTPITPELSEKLRRAFRKKFPKLCSLEKEEGPLKPFRYRDEQVSIIKAYGSKPGNRIARLHLDKAIDCGDTEAEFEIEDPSFAVDQRGNARYLDSGMWLVDAGDYDNGGKSELVFSISRYNRGGYEIFYDSLSKHASFEYPYH